VLAKKKKMNIMRILLYHSMQSLHSFITFNFDAEKCRLRVSEKKERRITSGYKKEEGTGGCRKLHSEEPYDLHYSRNVIKVIKSRRSRWVEHVAGMSEIRNPYKISIGTPERKRTLERSRCM
jgi:hypothetical protein